MTEQDKQSFIEAWEEFMEPLFEDGTLVFECSDHLKDHLLKSR